MKKILCGIMVISLVVGITYNKSYKVRECEVLGVYEDMMTVMHPNGHIYSLSIDEDDLRTYFENEVVEVMFDELHEWDTQYTVVKLMK